MPKDEIASPKKSHKKDKKKLKRIHDGTEQNQNPIEGSIVKSEGSTLEGGLAAQPHVSAIDQTTPQSDDSPVAKTDTSRCAISDSLASALIAVHIHEVHMRLDNCELLPVNSISRACCCMQARSWP